MSRLSFADEIAGWLRGTDMPVLVTGASGWLGQAVLEMLDAVLGGGMARRLTAYTSAARPLRLRSGRLVDALRIGRCRISRPRARLFFISHFARGSMPR